MDFKAEYKKSAEIMTPSPEAMERMKKNILAQTVNAPAKKPIPFKKISMIGGAVAACAVISVSAVTLLPMTKTPDSMVANGTDSHAMAAENANIITDRNLESEASKEEIHNSSINAPIADEDGNTGGMDNVSDAPQTDLGNETCDICCDTTEPIDETSAAVDDSQEASTDPSVIPAGDTGEAMDETGDIACETSEPCTETADGSCETGEATDDTEEAARPITIELSDDLSTAMMDGVKYILTDDGSSPPAGDMEFSDRFDGTTEYWVDIYGGEYFVLSTMDGRIIGGYTIAEVSP